MTTKPKPKVIAIYRVSALSQVANKRSGIAAQKAAVARAAIHHDLDVISEIELVGVSKMDIVNSPEFCDMLQKVSSCEIVGVVVGSLDRLTRHDTIESMSVLGSFMDSKALIYTEGEVLDLATKEGCLNALIKLVLNGSDRRLIAKRSSASRAFNRSIKGSESADAE